MQYLARPNVPALLQGPTLDDGEEDQDVINFISRSITAPATQHSTVSNQRIATDSALTRMNSAEKDSTPDDADADVLDFLSRSSPHPIPPRTTSRGERSADPLVWWGSENERRTTMDLHPTRNDSGDPRLPRYLISSSEGGPEEPTGPPRQICPVLCPCHVSPRTPSPPTQPPHAADCTLTYFARPWNCI